MAHALKNKITARTSGLYHGCNDNQVMIRGKKSTHNEEKTGFNNLTNSGIGFSSTFNIQFSYYIQVLL